MAHIGEGVYKYAFDAGAGHVQGVEYTFRADGGATLPAVERYSFGSSSPIEYEIKQAWTRRLTTGSRLAGIVSLEIDGERKVLSGSATLDVLIRTADGATTLWSDTGIAANAAGYFEVTTDPLVPAVGTVIDVLATITDSPEVYTSGVDLAIPEFVAAP